MSNSATLNKPHPARLLVTPGDPAGIGPDISLMLAAEHATGAAVVHIADPQLLRERATILGVPVRIIEIDTLDQATLLEAGTLQVLPVSLATRVQAGVANPANAGYVLTCLKRAADACVSGAASAMITGPVNKATINDSGVPFSGHTEYLAERLAAPLPVMMLASGKLRVALLTTHCPLAAVPAMVTAQRIAQVVRIVADDLRRVFRINKPRIAICGLNPHAGEQGHLGREEIEVIIPTVAALRDEGIDLRGPLPADTAFTADERARHDVILALYHDQGLTALKAVSFGDAVNVTLGLPIIRTSVDHGTAYDCAGRRGAANAGSLRAALGLAADLATGAAER